MNTSVHYCRNQDDGWPHTIAAGPFGEIDFVMPEHDNLVLVGVRYRANSDFSAPCETVDTYKQARWHAPAEYYLQNSPWDSKKACRFDIVAITGDGEDGMFRWSRDIF